MSARKSVKQALIYHHIRRECSMCKKPGAECVLLPPGDYDTIGQGPGCAVLSNLRVR